MGTASNDENAVGAGLRKVLDRHGFGFQYAVLRRIHDLVGEGAVQWQFEVAEFPLEVRDTGTRTDFILRHPSSPMQIIGECKRANPALARWAFARAPYVRGGRGYEPFVADRLYRDASGFKVSGYPLTYPKEAYHIGVELKTGEKGEQGDGGANRQAIEDAASQVMRQVGGLVEFYSQNQHLLTMNEPAVLVPVVFTTAELWVSSVDLSTSDLRTGVLPSNAVARQVDWLSLQYHLSPGIKHRHRPQELGRTLGEVLDSEYLRTIAIISPPGIAPFFEWLSSI